MRTCCTNVNANIESDPVAILSTESSKAIQTAARSRIKNDSRVKTVAQLLVGDAGDKDEVQAVGDERAQTTCPVLATPVVNPLMNTVYGHVYSTKGALQLLLQHAPGGASKYTSIDQIPSNISVRCPVAGCNKSFGPRTLKRDYAAEHSQRLHTATTREDEDDDEVMNMINWL